MACETGTAQSGRGRPSAEHTATISGHDALAVALGKLARELQRSDDAGEWLDEVVQAAVQLVPGAEEGSIADVIARSRIQHKAASNDRVRRVDLLMQETNQGPCLDGVWEQMPVRVEDIVDERRWPRFAERAAEAGVRSMLSFQLFAEGDNLGALNLYSTRPGAFTDESEHVGLLVASHAAVAYAGAQRQNQLEFALDTRDVIGRAIGIMMERHKISGRRAFTTLTRFSQTSNRKLRDIATEVVRDTEKRIES